MPPSIALVTADLARIWKPDADNDRYVEAFNAAGAQATFPVWSDESVDWSTYDLIVLRSPWDYMQHAPDFFEWLIGMDSFTNFHNPPDLLRWNLDKHYICDLRHVGVPVVPTDYVRSHGEWDAALQRIDAAQVVVKPTISAGSVNTGRFERDDPGAAELAAMIWAAGGIVMLQPAIASVASAGEIAVVVFDGVISHCLRKGPILATGGGVLGGEYTENVQAVELTNTIAIATRQVLDGVSAVGRERGWAFAAKPLLYARVDLVSDGDGSLCLLEAELTEPSFFLETAPGAADRFARAVLDRLRG